MKKDSIYFSLLSIDILRKIWYNVENTQEMRGEFDEKSFSCRN